MCSYLSDTCPYRLRFSGLRLAARSCHSGAMSSSRRASQQGWASALKRCTENKGRTRRLLLAGLLGHRRVHP